MPCLDSLARPINYLRISVTDRCNLRCIYCMPSEGTAPKFRHAEIMTFEEIVRVVEAAASLGITKIRLTGGEPLARLGIVDLVAMISAVPGIDDIAMTSNGTLLAHYAEDLKRAGLHRVNISLDTLGPERFRRITRMGDLSDVLAGIEAAERADLRPIKLNNVVMRGFNDDEVVDFARLSLSRDWNVRFIEVMPLGELADSAEMGYVPIADVRRRIEAALGPLIPAGEGAQGNGPARYYRLVDALGTVGFISAVSEHFCFRCNRLRLTADGRLRPCLLSDEEIDLRGALRQGANREELEALLQRAIENKPAGHGLAAGMVPQGRSMSQIGG